MAPILTLHRYYVWVYHVSITLLPVSGNSDKSIIINSMTQMHIMRVHSAQYTPQLSEVHHRAWGRGCGGTCSTSTAVKCRRVGAALHAPRYTHLPKISPHTPTQNIYNPRNRVPARAPARLARVPGSAACRRCRRRRASKRAAPGLHRRGTIAHFAAEYRHYL